MQRRIIQVEEKVPLLQGLPLSFQHLFAMFGASVLVPYLFNQTASQTAGHQVQVIDPALVLLLNGIGTLIYLFLCKGKAPAFLGSSFAFLSPTYSVIMSSTDVHANFQKALGGFILCGLVFAVTALIIGAVGTKWIDIVLPPAAMGPIVALIGLELTGSAAKMAGLLPNDKGLFDTKAIIVSMFTLAVVVLGSLMFRKFFAVIPVLVAVLVGYGLSAILKVVDYSTVTHANLIAAPHFVTPKFEFNAMIVILPAALVVISEHIGHLFVTGKIVGRDLIKVPGLHRSLLGDGLSTMISGFTGSNPTTTYGENMGVMAITRVYSVWVIGGAAVISIIISFIGVVSGAISSIPQPVMGGITLLLYGTIAASGIRVIVEAKVDYSRAKNLILTSLVFVTGLCGVSINIGKIKFTGMVLATVVGMALSLIFYILEKFKLTNDIEE
ncbi:MAG: uracil permease [Bacillota bacterium]|nr:uracil permease [Bacillota bacterium]